MNEPKQMPTVPQSVRIRVAGLVFSGDDILVVEHSVDSNRWHCFPGGGLEPGETLEDCLRRELKEELELTCEIEQLIAVGESIDATNHSVEFYFKCRTEQRILQLRCPTVTVAKFVARRALPELGVYPLELSADLVKYSYEELSSVRYYGRFL